MSKKFNKQTILWLAVVVVALVMLTAKAAPLGETSNVAGTIVQKTGVPGGAGNVRVIICDVGGELVRVTYDWDDTTKVGDEVTLIRLDR